MNTPLRVPARAPHRKALARLSAQQILDGYRAGRFHAARRDRRRHCRAGEHRCALQCDRDRHVCLGARRSRPGHEGMEGRRGKSAHRRADHDQGSDLCRRHAGQWRRSDAGRLRAGRRFRRGHRRESCRRDHHLQDHDLRVRLQTDRGQSGVGHHPQSVASRPHQRRVERRRRRRGRGRLRSARNRYRRRRLDPRAELVLRGVRTETHLRSGAPFAGILSAVVAVAGAHRTDRPHSRRCCPAA